MNSLSRIMKRLLPKGNFGSSVALLIGVTALSQGLIVLTSPILTRLYKPEDFGVLAVYISLLSIISVVASLRYEIAIPLAESDEIAANILTLSVFIVLSLSLSSGLLVWFFRDNIVQWTNVPTLKNYIWLLPLGLMGMGLYSALNYWAIRKKAYGLIARTKLNQGIMLVVTQLGLGIFKSGPLGLMLGQVMGHSSGSTTLALSAWRGNRNTFRKVSISGILQASKRYRRFPLLSSGSSLLDSAGQNLPAMMLYAFYGLKVAGFYALSQRVIAVPMVLIGQSLAQVYLGEASQLVLKNPKALQKLYLSTAYKLLLLSLVPVLFIGLLGPGLFTLIFGHSWLDAGKYAQLLAPMLLFQFIVNPISQTLNVLEKQDLQLIWVIAWLILIVASLTLSKILHLPPSIAVALCGIAMALAYAGHFVLTNIALKGFLKDKNEPRDFE